MGKAKISLILLIVGAIALLAIGSVVFLRKQKAAILVETQPGAIVFVNGEEVGRTPYEGEHKPGEMVLKLVPLSDQPLVPFETKVTLISGVKTIVRRTFGESEGESTSAIVSFEKGQGKEANIAVVTTPDASNIYLDGQFRDVSPVKLTGITAGVHELAVNAEGYNEQKFYIQSVPGYNLTAVVTLARDPQSTSSSPSPEPEESETTDEVTILNTPTGFLRVRSEPASSANEIGRVDPGKSYKLVEHDKEKGWFKILFEENLEGWISDEYATASATSNQ